MKKKLTLVIFLIHFGSVYSQNGFYITPVLQKKVSITKIQPWTFTTPQNLTIEIKPIASKTI